MQYKNHCFCKKASNIDIREVIYHKLKNWGWKKGHYRKAIENAKKAVAKLTSENCQWKSSFLIDLLTSSENISSWMASSSQHA